MEIEFSELPPAEESDTITTYDAMRAVIESGVLDFWDDEEEDVYDGTR
jgi:hypothetical protein